MGVVGIDLVVGLAEINARRVNPKRHGYGYLQVGHLIAHGRKVFLGNPKSHLVVFEIIVL